LSGSIQLFMGSDTAGYVAAIPRRESRQARRDDEYSRLFSYDCAGNSQHRRSEGKVLGVGLGRDLPYIHLTKILRDNGIDPKNRGQNFAARRRAGWLYFGAQAGRVQASLIIPPNHLVRRKPIKSADRRSMCDVGRRLNTSQPMLEKNRDMFIRFLKGYLEGVTS